MGSSLERGALHVWRIPLGDPPPAAWALLNEDERARAERLIVDAPRRQFVSARAALRTILGRYLEVDPRKVTFRYGEHGKPSLDPEHASEVCFNLSHSKDMALLAIALDRRLGVDVEHAKPGRDFNSIAEHFFSPRERAFLRSRPAEAVPVDFYRAWTRKEAYLKALGTGLTFASTRFSITYGADEEARVLETEMPGDRPDAWCMADLDAGEGYAAGVCWDGDPLSVVVHDWDRATLT